ncbi:GlxA family transcriptional regulator [Bradyrhizobium sp.]|jgi:transcriptional regulator GlxA family with amidase domain|uniref:GlxA family transcriptional regulator n=1 Tax=Bradyrhizobium sp. TaxID=376 RepID=UPI003C139C90
MTKSDIILPISDKRNLHQNRAIRIGFLLIDGFALMSYASLVEAFRAANVLSGRTLYEWKHISVREAFVNASNGARFRADAQIDDTLALDLLLVCAAGNPALFRDKRTFARLRYQASRKMRIGGVSGGPYILARAGLLDGYRCTIHWEHRPAFIEAFPQLDVQQGLYVIDRDRLTCAGGIAGLDLATALIAENHGRQLATMVNDWFLQTQLREAHATQRVSLRERYKSTNEKILATLAAMEANLEEPLSRAALARRNQVSVRQLERLFRSNLRQTIGTTYMRIRLTRAAILLKESSIPLVDIALASGFASASHFSRAFKRWHGTPPRALRNAMNKQR